MLVEGLHHYLPPREKDNFRKSIIYLQSSYRPVKSLNYSQILITIQSDGYRLLSFKYDCNILYIPLTNRVQGPYCKLQTECASRLGHKSKGKNEDP